MSNLFTAVTLFVACGDNATVQVTIRIARQRREGGTGAVLSGGLCQLVDNAGARGVTQKLWQGQASVGLLYAPISNRKLEFERTIDVTWCHVIYEDVDIHCIASETTAYATWYSVAWYGNVQIQYVNIQITT